MVSFNSRLKLAMTDVDFFCRELNTLKSKIVLHTNDSELSAKSLLCLLSADLGDEIKLTIYPVDEKELSRFKNIITRYGGTF